MCSVGGSWHHVVEWDYGVNLPLQYMSRCAIALQQLMTMGDRGRELARRLMAVLHHKTDMAILNHSQR